MATTTANPKPERKREQDDEIRTKKSKGKDETDKSALAQHAQNEEHTIDWPKVRTLWQNNIPRRLLVKESLVIRAYEPHLNRTTHSVPLLVFPKGVERKFVPDPNGRR